MQTSEDVGRVGGLAWSLHALRQNATQRVSPGRNFLGGNSCVGWKRGYYYSGGRYVGKDWIARVNAAIDADHAAINREMRDLARERREAEREAYHEARQRAAKVD